jgi:hypothetical protein
LYCPTSENVVGLIFIVAGAIVENIPDTETGALLTIFVNARLIVSLSKSKMLLLRSINFTEFKDISTLGIVKPVGVN